MSSSHISPSHIMDSLDISYRTFPQKTLCMCVYMCMYVHTYMLNISYRVQSLSRVWLFATPWTTAHQASLSITNSRSWPKLISTESLMPSNHLILCHPLLLSSVFPSITVFSNESALRLRWPKYWSFSFNISPYNEHPGLISFRMDWLDLLAVQGTLMSLLFVVVFVFADYIELLHVWLQRI